MPRNVLLLKTLVRRSWNKQQLSTAPMCCQPTNSNSTGNRNTTKYSRIRTTRLLKNSQEILPRVASIRRRRSNLRIDRYAYAPITQRCSIHFTNFCRRTSYETHLNYAYSTLKVFIVSLSQDPRTLVCIALCFPNFDRL
jgi:hypothetical protein